MNKSPLASYLEQTDNSEINSAFVAYIANLTVVAETSPEIARSIVKELSDQRSYLKMIASENYCSFSTQLAMGNLLTDKYAEGFPKSRFYEGCDNVDEIETIACEQAKKLFKCHHAYVQPHSGSDANLVAYWGILQARVQTPALEKLEVKDPGRLSHEEWELVRKELGNQRLMGMELAAGGHLSHGFRQNVSGKMFENFSYGVSPKTGLLDYEEIEAQALEVKPLILLAGYSSYPRLINFRKMREIADKAGSVLMVDMAHFAGLVAGGVLEGDYNPILHAQVVTSTTHKTLRGPRGGLVLSDQEFGEYMDKGCPFVLGGPLPHMMAAKAVSFAEANTDEFKTYAQNIVKNARILSQACMDEGVSVVSGGTDNHLFLIDVTPFGVTGRQAANALYNCGVTLNKNAIPFDKQSPIITSGLRLGTPALTTLGLREEEFKEIAAIIKLVLENTEPGKIASGKNAGKPSKVNYILDDKIQEEAFGRVRNILEKFPLYPELDLAFLQKHFG